MRNILAGLFNRWKSCLGAGSDIRAERVLSRPHNLRQDGGNVDMVPAAPTGRANARPHARGKTAWCEARPAPLRAAGHHFGSAIRKGVSVVMTAPRRASRSRAM